MAFLIGRGYGGGGLGPESLPASGTVELRCRFIVDMVQGLQGQTMGWEELRAFQGLGGICGQSMGGKMDKMRSFHLQRRTWLFMALRY